MAKTTFKDAWTKKFGRHQQGLLVTMEGISGPGTKEFTFKNSTTGDRIEKMIVGDNTKYRFDGLEAGTSYEFKLVDENGEVLRVTDIDATEDTETIQLKFLRYGHGYACQCGYL